MMTRRQLEKYIEELGQKGSVLGLEPIKTLLDKMGNPQDRLKFVHIAGTNGKGSVLAFTSTILKAAGYKVGRYISPVIYEYREKIQVGGKYITWNALLEGMSYIKEIIDGIVKDGGTSPTLFEVETALAFWYFDRMGCDIVVLETGLGGRDDATNVIKTTLIEAFAKISMDHMQILGKTLKDIATVKSGIIKDNTIVITQRQKQEVKDVLSDVCYKKRTKLIETDEIKNIKYNIKNQSFDYKNYKKLKLSLLGVWQFENAAEAIDIVLALNELGYNIDEKAIRKGLASTVWNGRFTIINKKPLVIMDGAHNEDASIRLRESIEAYLKDKELVYIVGVLADKEYNKVLANTLDLAKCVVTLTPPENKRALPSADLAKEALKYNKNVSTADSVEEALEMATLLAGKDCVIIAFGSLSYLGRLDKAVKKMYGGL